MLIIIIIIFYHLCRGYLKFKNEVFRVYTVTFIPSVHFTVPAMFFRDEDSVLYIIIIIIILQSINFWLSEMFVCKRQL
jgi:hypothetical protein